MRLLFVNEKLSYAGTTSYSLDLATSLRKLGHEVQLCTTGGELRKVFSEHGIETYSVRFNPLSYLKLLQFLREFQPELIHIQNQRSTYFGRRLSRRLRVPHIITVHRVPDATSPRLMDPLLAGIIAANENIRESLVNDQRIPKAIIRVIPRGVNTDLLSPERDVGSATPPSQLIPVVGSIGSLTRLKGHHVFIRAARRILDRGIEAMFAIVGEGEEEPELRKLVKELNLQYHMMFSPHVPSRRELYRVFDIVVVPTLRGGVGSTALEAMSMAKPIIATAVGELLHIVKDGKTALLVPEGDEVRLAERIVELIEQPDLRATLEAEARAFVLERFSLGPMIQATLAFYEEIRAKLDEHAAARALAAMA